MIAGIISAILGLAGFVMQGLKGSMDVDTISSKGFDLIMMRYKVGGGLITAAICAGAAAFVCWIISAIIPSKK